MAIGPTHSDEFPGLVRKSLASVQQEPLIYGSAMWFPASRGYTDALAQQSRSGVLVVTDESLLFLQWSKSTTDYDIVLKLDIADIRDISIHSFGVDKRIAVQSKDFTYQSFGFTRGNGGIAFGSQTQKVYDYLKPRIGS